MAMLVTVSEYAKSRADRGLSGGTRQAVDKAIDAGRISVHDGLIDPDIADQEWEVNTRKRMDIHGESDMPINVPKDSAMPQSWADAKARTESAVAELKELDLAERKGRLIDRSGYEMAAQKTARVLRDALVTTFPSKYALEFAALTDPWQTECRLRDLLRAELHAVCNMLEPETEEHASV
jgi:hypothetical protein